MFVHQGSVRIVAEKRIGIIGGSGLYEMEGVEVKEEISIGTPFGDPSDAFVLWELEGREVIFLPRHGMNHRLLPGEVPFRANIYGMKILGAEWIIAISAVGSMKEHIHPSDIALPEQFIDRTRGRADTFFGEGVVAHISFAQPVCPSLSSVVARAAETHCAEMASASKNAGAGANRNSCPRVHRGGTYLCIEGPAFSTRAESRLYRSWGIDVIGMTNCQEAKLAREAEICYATMAMVTDYDCWHESEADVSVEMLIENLQANAALAQRTIKAAVPLIPLQRTCPCATALRDALLTPVDKIPPKTKKKLDQIIGKYAGYSPVR